MALARALFRGAPIIVLDEPTASLDVQAEEAVFEQMNAEETRATKIQNRVKKVYYFSAESLMGRTLSNNLINLRIKSDVLKTLQRSESTL